MREILFRGKTEDGKWVDGFYTCFNCKEHRIYNGYAETDCGDYYPDYYSIIPETVGQYTGLTDKNGNKIFEGDIILSKSCNGSAISVVGYGEFEPKFLYDLLEKYVLTGRPTEKIYGLFASSIKNEEMFLTNGSHLIKVIGNIHDNPELLIGAE